MSKPNAVIHNFQASLEKSLRLEEESDWVAFYKRLWPEALTIVRVDKNCTVQKRGVDRMIWLPSDKQILVDEKRRDKDYGDVLLEEWNVGSLVKNEYTPKPGKPGWAIDDSKHCDFIAYAIPCARKCYMLPFELLRITTCINLDRWKSDKSGNTYWPIHAANEDYGGYWTRSIGVKWPTLLAAMKEQMLRSFGSTTELPPMLSSGFQLEFGWD